MIRTPSLNLIDMFRMVHEDSEANLEQGIVPPGYEIKTEERLRPDGTKMLFRYLVNKKAERGLTSHYIKQASVVRHPVTNEPEIHFEFDENGTRLFAEITRRDVPRKTAGETKIYQLAMVLDGELISAPRIMAPVEGGRGVLVRDFTASQASELALALAHSLPVPLTLVSEKALDSN